MKKILLPLLAALTIGVASAASDSDTYRWYARVVAQEQGINPNIFVGLIETESHFDPDAYNPISEATGIAQIIQKYHPTVNPRNPNESLRYTARYLRESLDLFGSYPLAIASWHAGRNAVAACWCVPYAETREYVRVVTSRGGERDEGEEE